MVVSLNARLKSNTEEEEVRTDASPARCACFRVWGSGFRVSVTEAGSCLGLIDSCITQLKAQGLSRTCNESKKEEEASPAAPRAASACVFGVPGSGYRVGV